VPVDRASDARSQGRCAIKLGSPSAAAVQIACVIQWAFSMASMSPPSLPEVKAFMRPTPAGSRRPESRCPTSRIPRGTKAENSSGGSSPASTPKDAK
jgi:hypothetical protein